MLQASSATSCQRNTCHPEASFSGRSATAPPVSLRATRSTKTPVMHLKSFQVRHQASRPLQRAAAGICHCGPGTSERVRLSPPGQQYCNLIVHGRLRHPSLHVWTLKDLLELDCGAATFRTSSAHILLLQDPSAWTFSACELFLEVFVFLKAVTLQNQERPGDFSSGRGEFHNTIRVPATAMASLKGSMGGVTLERSKLDLRQKVQTVEPKLSNDGGGGGIGNKIFNGGGGDGDDGDDDDYFNFDGGDGDGDESFWRTAVSIFYLWKHLMQGRTLTKSCFLTSSSSKARRAEQDYQRLIYSTALSRILWPGGVSVLAHLSSTLCDSRGRL